MLLGARTSGASPVERMRPAAAPNGHLTTESSQVVPAWAPSATLLLSYGHATRSETNSIEITQRASTHILAAFGIAGWAQLDVDLPIAIYQSGLALEGSVLEPIGASALGDLRVGVKGTLLRTPRRGFGLGLALDVTAPTGDSGALMGWDGVSVAPQVLVDHSFAHGILLSANVGYWVRPDVDQLGTTLGDAVTYRAAVRVPISPKDQFSAIAELDGLVGVTEGASHPLSMRLGLRWNLRSGVILGLYGGGAVMAATGVPDVQGVFTVGYAPPGLMHTERAFRSVETPSAVAWARRSDRRQDFETQTEAPAEKIDPADSDRDGITALGDACRNVAEDVDGFEDDDGCPELDNDRDSLRDREDLCPNAPELINGYLDHDGCPDRRKDRGGETFATFDARRVLPHVQFASETAELDDAAQKALDEVAELLRLNPWLERLTLTVYVARHDKPHQEHALATAQAEAITAYLVARGVEPWRVHASPARAVPTGVETRVRLTLTAPVDGLRPFAPELPPALASQPVAPKREPAAGAPGPVLEAQGPRGPGDAPASAPRTDGTSRNTQRSTRP